MIKIAIVEDENNECVYLKSLVERFFHESKLEYSCTEFKDGLEFIENYNSDYDIVLMDIEMPHMNGLKSAEKLRKIDPAVALIFVTNLASCAYKGYEVDATGFIVKPARYAALKINLRKAINRAHNKEVVKLTVVTRQGVSVILSNELKYIEVMKHELKYHTENGTVTAYGSLKTIEAQLSPDNFVRCSSSFLVNLRFVKSIVEDTVFLLGSELPISRGKKKDFVDKLMKYVGGGSSLL